MCPSKANRAGLTDLRSRVGTAVVALALLGQSLPALHAQTIDWVRQFGGFMAGGTDAGTAVDGDGNTYIAGYTESTLPGQAGAGGHDAFLRKYDAAGNEIWTRQFGTYSTDRASAVVVDATGVYVTGSTWGEFPGQPSEGGSDVFVRKYDAAGNEVWTRQFGLMYNDNGNGIAADETGVYIAGAMTHPYTSTEAFVRKYDTAGNEVWTREFGTPSADVAYGIAANTTGICVAGYTRGTLPGQTSAGDQDAFVRKYDAAGNEVWTHQFGWTGVDKATAVALHGNSVYITGSLQGTYSADGFVRAYIGSQTYWVVFGAGGYSIEDVQSIAVDSSGVYIAGATNGVFPGETGAGGDDAFIRKYDLGLYNVLWTRQFGTSLSDWALGIATDATGVYMTGYSASGGRDAFVRKYDAAGLAVWTRWFGGLLNSPDFATAIDGDGNVYVTGYTDGALPGQVSVGSRDAFVRKYDAIGNEIWTRQFGTPLTDYGYGVAVDGTGVYVTGSTEGTLPGQAGAGASDCFVRKYDVAGNEVWTRQFGTSSYDNAYAIAADATGIYVIGSTYGALPGQVSTGSYDVFVRKYEATGNEAWTRQFGTPSSEEGMGIAADATGIYATGYTWGTFPGQSRVGGYDIFVRKYDLSGNHAWTRQFGTTAYDYGYGIAASTTGVYVTGSTYGALPGQSSAGGADPFVRKYDAAGNHIWTRQFGTAADESTRGIAADAAGVCVTGSTYGTLPGQVKAGDSDAFVRRYLASGNEDWTLQFGTAASDTGRGVLALGSTVYIVGSTSGIFPGQVGGGQDAFVAKVTVEITNQPPVALCRNITVSADVSCWATLTPQHVDNGSYDPDNDPITLTLDPPGPFARGVTQVTLTVDDGNFIDQCTATVTVVDNAPPAVTCSVDLKLLDRLWPPNHELGNVGLTVVATDNCDPDESLTKWVEVFADEDDEEPTGDGTHSPDAKDLAPTTLRLRAERRGDGNGRVYLIIAHAQDTRGNVDSQACTVVVPLSNSHTDISAVQAEAATALAEFEMTSAAPSWFFLVGDGEVIGSKQ